VIADHIRACTFLIADGVLPSNEGRGYVLRRIIRRAIRHGYKLGQTQPFFHTLVGSLEQEMGVAYPELKTQRVHVERVLKQEEERFAETLSKGMALLDQAIASMQGQELPGETVFKLYDTFGFPVDLTADIARERGLSIDHAGFEAAMEAQRERARDASKFGVDLRAGVNLDSTTDFGGYESLVGTGTVVALFKDKERVEVLQTGETGQVVLDRTPFYAESGGQIGDSGVLTGTTSASQFEVRDTQKVGKAHAHLGKLTSGEIKVGDVLQARVDEARRVAIKANHSATHLLHAALRQVLGGHVTQKGSLVAPDRLRFDFSHYTAVSPAQVLEIERLVNSVIRSNAAAETNLMKYDDAVASGAMALFGEKYEEDVRVLRFGEFSTELCGGTHVDRVGDIGLFKILSESGVAAGVRRIEAVTGEGAYEYVSQSERVLRDVAGILKASRDEVEDKLKQLLDRQRRMEKELAALKSKLASGQGNDLTSEAVEVAGMKVVATRIDGADAASLRDAVDQLKNKLKTAAIVLASVPEPGKVVLIAGVTADRTNVLKAGDLVNSVAQQVGGRGGGRADLAQAGGNDPTKLDEALKAVPAWIEAQLAATV
jgi:alanyl-tRNA synthetase